MKSYLLIAIVAFTLLLTVTFVSAKWHRPDNFREWRERFIQDATFRHEFKAQLQACAGNTNATCNATREEARKIAIGFLHKVCANYSEILDKIKTKINNSRKLTAEEKANLTALLNEKEKKFEELCNRINETNNSSEVKEIFRELKNLTQDIREEIRVSLGLSREKRVGLIIQRMTHLQEKLERFLANYKGANKEKIANLIEQFKNKLLEANATYQESKTLWEQASQQIQNKENASETIRQANAKMQEAQNKLREAHAILMQIVRELVGAKEAEKLKETGGEK